jgi:hypothetical protein
VDSVGDTAVVRVTVGPAPGDDVLRDLARQLLRRLLVEVDDRGDVACHVGDEEILDDHGEPQG